MANNKMLIDASHPEETRVVVVRGNRIEEFDFEAQERRQLRGNIYLAKVTRVEPSLQAAFIDYGGNRHGFLAFSEIHPDYYQIPAADRQALLEAEEEAAAAEAAELDAADEEEDNDEEGEDGRPSRRSRRRSRRGSRRRDRNEASSGESDGEGSEDDGSDDDGTADEDDRDEDRDGYEADDSDGADNDDDSDDDNSDDDDDDADGDDEDASDDEDDDEDEADGKVMAAAIETDSISEPAPEDDGDGGGDGGDGDGGDEAPQKKRRAPRKKAPSRKKAAASEAGDKADDADQSADAGDAGEPEVETGDAPAEAAKKAKPRRARRKKAEPAEAAADEAASETAAQAEEPQGDAGEDGEEAAKPAKRSRRSSKSRSGSKRKDASRSGQDGDADDAGGNNGDADGENGNGEAVESLGSEDALEEARPRARPRRQYKIQEVIRRRQVMLVQVVKEERGNKGAALTTYLSLAGRYSVLMPNTARGGGISRKITNAADRKRLKEIATSLEVPRGMGVILRTAGASRTPQEIKRDFEYLMRLWENVRNLTLESTAPFLVYEEGSLIKRSIRDLYDKDTGEIIVSGEEGYREAKEFMRMLMPSHAKNVKLHLDDQPLLSRYNVESQLDKMLAPQVTLKSGGYLVINQTEALVAIDVNSGRSTREHSIEATALQTNLEAAEEVARQLRLRDLAGLIVIDFIDMDEKRNNRAVERKIKECLKQDRARIQVGHISHFGLLEMSRQRIRASVLESTMAPCPHCGGLGHVRSDSSLAIHILRTIEEHLQRHSRFDVTVRVTRDVALYIFNNKRQAVSDLEGRYGVHISFEADASISGQDFFVEKGAAATGEKRQSRAVNPMAGDGDEDEEADTVEEETPPQAVSEADGEDGNGRKRKRRRRRGRGDRDERPNGFDDEESGRSSENGASLADDADSAGADEEAPDSADDDGGRAEDGGKPESRRRGGRGRGRTTRVADDAGSTARSASRAEPEAARQAAKSADESQAEDAESARARDRRQTGRPGKKARDSAGEADANQSSSREGEDESGKNQASENGAARGAPPRQQMRRNTRRVKSTPGDDNGPKAEDDEGTDLSTDLSADLAESGADAGESAAVEEAVAAKPAKRAKTAKPAKTAKTSGAEEAPEDAASSDDKQDPPKSGWGGFFS